MPRNFDEFVQSLPPADRVSVRDPSFPVRQLADANKAVKSLRDAHPTADAIAGIHPYVAALQVANDLASTPDGGTAINALQAIPAFRQAKLLDKGMRYAGMVVDPRRTALKNSVLTQGQLYGQSNDVE